MREPLKARFLDLCTPHVHLQAIRDLAPDWLLSSRIAAVLADLDNTLVPYGHREVEPATIAYVKELLRAGLHVVIVSNAGSARVGRVAAALEVPFVAGAGKPSRRAFERALASAGQPAGRAVGVGDQVLRDVLGARRAGLYSVLVNPLTPRDFPGTALLRAPERLVMARLRRLGRWPEMGLPDPGGLP